MSIKVLELTKSNELVELSIDEQIKIQGGHYDPNEQIKIQSGHYVPIAISPTIELTKSIDESNLRHRLPELFIAVTQG